MGCNSSTPSEPTFIMPEHEPERPSLRQEDSSRAENTPRRRASFSAGKFTEVIGGMVEVEIVCPPGLLPGDQLKVELPDGAKVYLDVPKGAKSGKSFKARIPNKRKVSLDAPSRPGSASRQAEVEATVAAELAASAGGAPPPAAATEAAPVMAAPAEAAAAAPSSE